MRPERDFLLEAEKGVMQDDIAEATGVVFNIQRFSLHDGTGIRTTVFLKGCPLRCVWCHSPQSQSSEKQLLFMENRCIGCGACAFVCPAGAVKITDEGDERIMETWQDTKLKLQACEAAQKTFATQKCIALVSKRYPELPEELKNLCAEARRIKFAGEMHLGPRKK